MHNPFALPEVVSSYETWYATPWGAVADRIERALLIELLAPAAAMHRVQAGPGSPPPTLLEIGCGTAHFASTFTAAGYRPIGIDPAPAMLDVARQRLPVACADGLRLPFRDGAFDAAALITVLEFTPDPAALLREARRVARRRVVVLTLSSRSWLGLRRRLAGKLGHPIFAHIRPLSRARLLDAARRAGAEPGRLRTALVLPPALAGRLPGLEERLSSGALPGGGIIGMALPGGG